ncbi:MAG: AEC family transporter [Clostridia bacterium]|nr:AEC family transporter [Clostridia bacterium]
MDLVIIIEQIIKLFIVIAIGYVGAKSGYLPVHYKDIISKVIVKITLPLLIITSMMSKELSADTLLNTGVAAGSAVVVIVVLYAIGLLSAKIFRLSEPTKTVHALISATGNVVFLGYPVISAVYGAEGLFYAVIYGIINDVFLWSIGVYLVNKSTGNASSKEALKKLLNPNTVSCILGIILLVLGVKLPGVIFDTLSGLGNLTTNLSMLFIGMVLSTISVSKIYKRVSMFAVVVLKMIAVPVLAAYLLSFTGVNPITCGAIVLQIAMPAQTVMSIITNEAGSDVSYSAEYIFISTVLSIGTLPLVYYLAEKFI